jgi:phosphohistidine phosphatase
MLGPAILTMDLYIMRHGIAEDQSHSGADRDRALTSEGIEKTKASAEALKNLGVEFNLILTSPYTRALETARIVAKALDCELKEFAPLAAGGNPDRVFQALTDLDSKFESLLLVGHEPDLSRLISICLSGSEDLSLTMKKGGFCRLSCLKLAPGQARLEWLLAPKHLVKMA